MEHSGKCAGFVSFQDSLLDYSAADEALLLFVFKKTKKDSLVVHGIVSRTALSARLCAVDRQLGREHLLVAVLGDLSTGLVHHPRAALVRARAGGCTTTRGSVRPPRKQHCVQIRVTLGVAQQLLAAARIARR